ncbi:MAG: alpha/beta hydrolase [Pararheinheimera sp.]|nr:alpha/beta hydrolase [Rheinheimera sp.]
MKFILICCALFSFSLSAAGSKLVKVKDVELEYEIAGTGKTIVLLEGGGVAGLSDWDPVFQQMAKQATVIRYSRAGNGNSTAIKRHFSSADYAAYTSELLYKLNIKEPVILVAHSYGGNVARDFSASYPQQIKALLLLDPSSEHDVDIMRAIDLQRANSEIAQIKLDDMANGMSNQYLDFWSKRPFPDYPQIKEMPVTVIASVKTHEKPANLFFTDQARRMWGELWQQWAATFPQGRAVLTKKSGHYVQFDEPELVLSELQLLIEKLAQQP